MKSAALSIPFLVLTGCGKPEEPRKAGATAPAVMEPPIEKDPRHDYSNPYLTDGRMAKLLKSMEEEKNPFDYMFGEGGPPTFSQMTERLAELNGFARRFGFQDSEDYCAVWGRVAVCGSALASREMTDKLIEHAKEELQKPDLSAEAKKRQEELVASLTKSREETGKDLNPADLAVVQKYRTQIAEAKKKYQKR